MIEAAQILGSWTRSHEEDHDGLEVYRPADHPFPPARGRMTFTLLPDDRAVVGRPGPDDRGTTDDGTWSLEERPEGDALIVALPGWQATYLVVAADSEHLELQPIAPF